MILGLVPARGGSKGVPGKNLRRVRGKPLVAHAVECGLRCPSLHHVMVSTDSPEIAEAARAAGADVPFIRPAELARDSSAMLPVMQHALAAAEGHYGRTVEVLVLLDPTAPLRTVEDVEGALRMLRESGGDAVVSGSRSHRSPYFNMVERSGPYVRLVREPAVQVVRRQDAPETFDLNTVVWAYTRRGLMDQGLRLPERTALYVVPEERALDLDTELDFEILDFLLARRESDTPP